MGGSGDGGIVEITPRRLENVEMKTVQETLNTTDNSTTETATTASIATLATANSNVTGGPNVNLIHLDPTMAPVITTESFEAYGKLPEQTKKLNQIPYKNQLSLYMCFVVIRRPTKMSRKMQMLRWHTICQLFVAAIDPHSSRIAQ